MMFRNVFNIVGEAERETSIDCVHEKRALASAYKNSRPNDFLKYTL